MKLPRDLSGEELARALRHLGYEMTRQTGSHMRLTWRAEDKEHHVTIPAHKELKVGTLSEIITDVALNLGLKREELIRRLFG